MKTHHLLCVLLLAATGCAGLTGPRAAAMPWGDQRPSVLETDGGWCWFQSPRALIHGDRLLVGSVASGSRDRARHGDIDLIVHDFASSRTQTVELYDQLEEDDHAGPGLLVRPDGRVLAVFSRHNEENHFYYRISQPDDPLNFGPVQTFTPSNSTRVTYSNLYLLPAEENRIYDFYRGLDNSFKPSYAYSDDLGETWKSGSVFIRVPSTQKHRPYVRYASNGVDTIHMLYTEAHPRDYDNSLYDVYYRDQMLHQTDGTPIRTLLEGLNEPAEGTRIYQGDADHVAWCSDVVLDQANRPVAVYSVQVGSAGLPVGQGGDDLRYRYARWDGKGWQDHALAYAGTRLYSGEDDYSGLVTLDPVDPRVVYFSTDADPKTGAPLISRADGKRHYEIYRGVTRDGGATWDFAAVTHDSIEDNLRPIRPKSDSSHQALLWLRGTYRSYTDFDQRVLGVFWE